MASEQQKLKSVRLYEQVASAIRKQIVSGELPVEHPLRVAIAGHDKDYFKRIPQQGSPLYRIYRQRSALSFIDVPVMGKRASASVETVDPFAF